MNQLKGVLYGILSSSTFGLIPLFAIPALNAGVGIDSVMFYRFGISSLVIGIYLLTGRHNLSVSVKEFATLFGLGMLYALTALFLTHSYFYIPSGIATTIHFLYPVVVTAVMVLFFKDRVSMTLVLATILAISGVYLLGSGDENGVGSPKGLLFVLLTVVTYALYIVGVNKSCVHKMDGLKMTFFVLFSCTIVFGLNLLVKGGGLDLPQSWTVWGYLFLLALIPTLVSDLTLILSVQHVGSTTTAILGCMEPLTAVVMGVLFLNERFGGIQSLGMAAVLVAVSMVVLSGQKKGVAEPEQVEIKK